MLFQNRDDYSSCIICSDERDINLEYTPCEIGI